jgi:hypothetical protein
VRHCYPFTWLAILAVGCSSSPSGQPGNGSGGASGFDAQPSTGSGGAMSVGGSSGNVGATDSDGGTDLGGVGGASGGADSGAIDGGRDARNGSEAGLSDGGGGDRAAVSSAGCGKSGRPTGGTVIVDNDHIYDFPTSSDGKKPMPVVFILHGANNPHTLLETQTNGSRLATNFVRVFPKSVDAAWAFNGGTGPGMQRLATIYDDLVANYCVDASRVFLSGHSSGAQMSVQMICVPGGDML